MPERAPIPGFKYELCTGCGQCVTACPEGVLEMRDMLPHLQSEVNCSYCGNCEEECPTGAIYLFYEILFAPESD